MQNVIPIPMQVNIFTSTEKIHVTFLILFYGYETHAVFSLGGGVMIFNN